MSICSQKHQIFNPILDDFCFKKNTPNFAKLGCILLLKLGCILLLKLGCILLLKYV